MTFARLGALAAAAAFLSAGCDSARPLEQRSELGVCERCHGFPPPDPHPQAAGCNQCHSTTVAPGDVLVEGGGDHLNGRVDIVAHEIPYVLVHDEQAILGLGGCTACHGSDFDGGAAGVSCNDCHGSLTPDAYPDWQTNCTFCHGTRTPGWNPAQQALAAPPQTAAGTGPQTPAARGVGAHQIHLTGGALSNGVACGECHPARTGLAHVDGAVQLEFGALASTGGATPTFDPAALTCSNYCHGATLPPSDPARAAPVWAPPSALDCNSCHQGNPTTGRHPAVSNGHGGFGCNACHGGTYTSTTADRAIHVNGTIDLDAITGWDASTRSCAAICHPTPTRPWGG